MAKLSDTHVGRSIIIGAFVLSTLPACSASPEKVAEATTVTVERTMPTTVLVTEMSTQVDTATETVTSTVTSTVTPTSAVLKVSKATACDLLVNFASVEDGPIAKFTSIVDNLKSSYSASETTEIASKTTEIRETLSDIVTRAPADMEPYIQALINYADELIAVMNIGHGTLDNADFKSAALEIINVCKGSI